MRALSILAAAAAGALATFFLDAEQGRRRRAIARERLTSGLHRASDASQAFAGNLRNRTRGLAAGARRRLERAPVSGEQLAERVRARIGRFVSHPGSIEVEAVGGEIVVSGPVLEAEAGSLLSAVRRTPGVQSVVDRLERHAEAGNVPGLQG